jgi:hypothetical protein
VGQYGAIIGGVIGAIIGSFVPGLGTAAGWAIGSALGGAYSASQQVIPGPKIGDVQQQTSQEGGFRPIVYSRSIPMSGNIIADSEPLIIKKQESGKGGPKVESEYAYRTYAVGFCEGEAELLQAWRNGILVYNVEDSSMAAENAKFLEYARWYTGSFDQNADPDLEVVYGVGNAPFFRGTSYLVLAGEDVTDLRGAWAQWQVRVFRGALSQGEPATWLASSYGSTGDSIRASADGEDWTASGWGITNWNAGRFVRRDSDGALIAYNAAPPLSAYKFGVSLDNGATFSMYNTVGMNASAHVVGWSGGYWHMSSSSAATRVTDAGVQDQVASSTGFGTMCVASSRIIGFKAARFWHADASGDNWVDFGDMPVTTLSTTSMKALLGGPDGNEIGLAGYHDLGATWRLYVLRSIDNGITFAPYTPLPDITPPAFGLRTLIWYDAGLNLWAVVIHNRVVFGASLSALAVSSHTFSGLVREIGSDGDKFLFACADGIFATSDFITFTEVSSQEVASVVALGEVVPPGAVTGDDWTLNQVVTDVCDRVNLPEGRINLEKMDPDTTVRGYTIGNAYQAAGILQTLSGVFFFDPANANGSVAFVRRGMDAAATILDDDMIDDGEDVEDAHSRRQDSLGIPRVLHLNYYDVAGGLNTDKQRSERPEGTRAEGEQSLQTPVVLSADEAASVVAITHGMMVEQQKGELSFALPDNWLHLTESDPVFVETNNKMVRAILTRVELDDGEQRYKAIRDRQSLYTTQVQGIPAAPVTRPPSSVAGPTLVEFIDIQILRDSHDQLGFYMAVSGVLPAWPGALVELSLDAGATYIQGQSTRASSIMGELVTSLGDHPAEYPDTVNSCQVDIDTPSALLENTDLTGMLNRTNRALIGDEIVNFADANEVSPGTWELSTWLRGRKGTTTASHAIGTRFVLLDTVMFIPAELSWLNRTLTFRAATFGRPVSEATIIGVTFTGQSQTERSPAYLQAYRDGTDVVASWQGVGRLGGGATVAMGAYFLGYRLTLTDGVTTQTVDTTANDYTGSLAAFAGSVTMRVQQRNQFTGLGPYIEVTI